MIEEKRGTAGKWAVRVAALVALAASLVLVGLVVAGSIDSGEDGAGAGADNGAREEEREDELAGCMPEAEDAVEAGFYVVQEGDILSSIALRTCVPEPELVRLNSDVDPQTLSPGQCLSLVERGCKQRNQ